MGMKEYTEGSGQSNADTLAKFLGKPVAPKPEISPEMLELIKDLKPEDFTKVEADVFSQTRPSSYFPPNPEDGVFIVVIKRGKHRDKGWNAMYCRPGQTVRSGSNEIFYYETLDDKRATYDRALEWARQRKLVDLAKWGPITEDEKKAEKQLARSGSRREGDYAQLTTWIAHIRSATPEQLRANCAKRGLVCLDDTQRALALVQCAVDTVFGKD